MKNEYYCNIRLKMGRSKRTISARHIARGKNNCNKMLTRRNHVMLPQRALANSQANLGNDMLQAMRITEWGDPENENGYKNPSKTLEDAMACMKGDQTNLHVWVEDEDGKKYDYDYNCKSYKMIREEYGLSGESIYEPLNADIQKSVWNIIFNRTMKKKIKYAKKIGLSEEDFCASYVMEHEEEGCGCAFRAYLITKFGVEEYSGDASKLKIVVGSLGWKNTKTGAVYWAFG